MEQILLLLVKELLMDKEKRPSKKNSEKENKKHPYKKRRAK